VTSNLRKKCKCDTAKNFLQYGIHEMNIIKEKREGIVMYSFTEKLAYKECILSAWRELTTCPFPHTNLLPLLVPCAVV